MKSWLKIVMASGVAVMVVVGLISFVHAGGAINWKVTVSNPTDSDVQLYLYYGVGGSHKKENRVTKGGSYTLETGAQCPHSLGGWVYNAYVDMVVKCVNGIDGACGVYCADSRWKITKHSDGAYHFDKD